MLMENIKTKMPTPHNGGAGQDCLFALVFALVQVSGLFPRLELQIEWAGARGDSGSPGVR